MDIHWRNKVIKLIAGSIVVFMLLGCKSHKKIAENTVSVSLESRDRIELVTKENPYKIEMKETIIFDSVGVIVPMKLSIEKDGIIGNVILENNELIYTLEKKDTTVVSKEIKEVVNTNNTTKTEVIIAEKKGFFERIKSYLNTIIWTLICSLAIYLIYKVIRKFYFPI